MSQQKTASKKTDQLEFKAQDFHHYPKNLFWYLGISLLLLGALAVAFSLGDYLIMAVVVAVGIAVFRLADLQSHARTIRLTPRGVYWGPTFLGYHQLRAFWFATEHGKTTLYLERLNFLPQISFSVTQTALAEAVEYLARYLPLHDHRGEPLADRFARLLRL